MIPREADGGPEESSETDADSCLILRARGVAARPCAEERVLSSDRGLRAKNLPQETRLLLLRQRYRAQLELGELEGALADAEAMTELAVEGGLLRAVAHHDAARVLEALGRLQEALTQQTKAALTALPSARSFHYGCLATLQQFAGDRDAALASIDRALRWAQRDRLLLEAHRAHLLLEGGVTPENLEDLLTRLRADPATGYTRYLHGMICASLGNLPEATRLLRGWLAKNGFAPGATPSAPSVKPTVEPQVPGAAREHAQRRPAPVDPVKRLTLAEEIRRADRIVQRGIGADSQPS